MVAIVIPRRTSEGVLVFKHATVYTRSMEAIAAAPWTSHTSRSTSITSGLVRAFRFEDLACFRRFAFAGGLAVEGGGAGTSKGTANFAWDNTQNKNHAPQATKSAPKVRFSPLEGQTAVSPHVTNGNACDTPAKLAMHAANAASAADHTP